MTRPPRGVPPQEVELVRWASGTAVTPDIAVDPVSHYTNAFGLEVELLLQKTKNTYKVFTYNIFLFNGCLKNPNNLK